MTLPSQVAAFARDIRLEHTVFALPFALIGALAAARGLPDGRTIFWVVVAMATARTAAMGWNRVADARFDAANPRTADRAMPAGRLSPGVALGLVAVSACVFLVAAWRLNPLAARLAPAALAIVLGYSFTKRATALSHLFLGMALSCAPAGGWIAVAGRLDPPALWLVAAVTAWVAGFDVIYATADEAFDRAAGLRSIPAAIGTPAALRVSAALHAATVAALAGFGAATGAGAAWGAGVAAAAGLLGWEHLLVRRAPARLPTAFFTANAWVGAILLAAYAADLRIAAW